MAQNVGRRELLKLAGAGLLGLAVGLGGGYTIGRRVAEAEAEARRKIKALWIYVGPIEDIGWTAAHHESKENVSKMFDWLEAKHIPSVREEEALRVIEAELRAEEYHAVFATSYGFKEAVKTLAKRYPDVKFYHCSGEYEDFAKEGLNNVATYFAEFYQLYFLNGVAGGAVTETCRVGYVPAFLIPEVVRHINAFALGAVYGAKLAGKCGGGRDLKIYVTKPLKSWFAPDKAKEDARYLVESYNVDVLAYTEDTTAVLDVAEEYWGRGRRVYSFSHYSDMYTYYLRKYGRRYRSHLTGQVADWTPIVAYLLAKLYAGFFESEDVWARLGDFSPFKWARKPEESRAGKPEGAVYLAELNTEVIPPAVIREIKRLYEEMKELMFEPFSGEVGELLDDRDGIYGYKIDFDGNPLEKQTLKIPKGRRASRDDLWYMDWFYWKIERV
ncbi:MAG: BMP family ABC transporter substrate-binding protein [Acidilobaceae archaeon]